MEPALTWAIILLPVIAALANGLAAGRLARPWPGLLACVALAASFVLSLRLLFFAAPLDIISGTWIESGPLRVGFQLRVDHLSAIMACIVSGIGLLIHIYSLGYMAHDARFSRFFACLNLFAGAMLLLVLAGDLLLLYVGWEGVGLCSYLLIGHWFERPDVPAAATKAMLVNRVGDACLLSGMLLLGGHFAAQGGYTLAIEAVTHNAAQATGSGSLVTVICLLLFIGATAKSAQLPALWVWLPDAMAGPTPVSALIHAATMVTAGVYLLARLHVLFAAAPIIMMVVAVIGIATALFAAIVAVVQNDIKKVLAYSTISQLGYMFAACGIGAYGAAIFHLFTHAFFKALLFLGAGAVIHALDDEQDMTRMGGLARRMPITYLTFLAGALSLAALPIWSGFFSKEAILSAAFQHAPALFGLALLTATLTAYYSFRQVAMVFHGEARSAVALGAHDPSPAMAVPLVVLAAGATLVGFLGLPAWSHLPDLFERYLRPVIGEMAPLPASLGLLLSVGAILAAAVGVAVARASFSAQPSGPRRWEVRYPALTRLIAERFYIETVLGFVFVRGGMLLARLLAGPVDQGGIDGLVEGSGRGLKRLSRIASRAQTGFIPDYLFVFVIGAFVALAAVVWRVWR